MNIAELKIDIVNKIANIKELRIIEEIQNLLDFELDKGIFKLSDSQKQRIGEAKADDIITNEDANDQIEKWLKEK